MSDVYVSCGVRKISKSEEPLVNLFIEGVEGMLREFESAYPNGAAELDAIILTSAHPVELNDATPDELCDAVSDYLKQKGLDVPVHYFHKPGIYTDEANLSASAAGAALLHEGIRRVAFGGYGTVGLVAAEQMRTPSREQSIDALRSLIHPEEKKYGVTMPALAALLTNMLVENEPLLADALKKITSLHHTCGEKNPRAHIRKGFTPEEYDGQAEEGGKNSLVSSPLRLWDVAPRSAGYAALVISDVAPEDEVKVKIAGYGQGIDKIAVSQRDVSRGSEAMNQAVEQLKEMINLPEVGYAELHDAFPIVTFLGLIATGLLQEKDAIAEIIAGETAKEGTVPTNLSGGLLCGHALAASGLGQVVELMKQAKGEAEVQLDNLEYPHFSLTLSVGGFSTYDFATLLYASRDDERSFSLQEIPEITRDDFDTDFPELPEGEFTAKILSHTSLEYPPSEFDSPLTITLCAASDTGERFLAHSSDDIRIGETVKVKKNDDGLFTVKN